MTPRFAAHAALIWPSAPLSYLTAAGDKARLVLPLTLGVLIISLAVITIICALVAVGVWRRGVPDAVLRELPVGGVSGLSWIYIGVGISGIALLAAVFWTMWVLVKTSMPDRAAAITVTITAHQWWWEVLYRGATPSETFTTANEIHIPAGTPVRFELKSADVIHSFWVPRLTGKTDLVPGQTNVTWLDASQPGVYRGQCGEYCGLQHAHMAFVVVAQAPVLVEAVVDPHEPPLPPKITASQSLHFAEALAKGTPNARKIALTAISDKVRESSDGRLRSQAKWGHHDRAYAGEE